MQLVCFVYMKNKCLCCFTALFAFVSFLAFSAIDLVLGGSVGRGCFFLPALFTGAVCFGDLLCMFVLTATYYVRCVSNPYFDFSGGGGMMSFIEPVDSFPCDRRALVAPLAGV